MNATQKPRLIIVAGPNGSGKTTITDKLLRHEWMDGCVYINPDLIAQRDFGDWNSEDAVIRAANHAKQLREDCLSSRNDMAVESVFSTCEKVEFVKKAKAAGFFVRLFFICTDDPSINAKRVAMRVMEGGHDVPIGKIIKRYYLSLEKCIKALQLVDRAYFYDNTKTNTDSRLIFRVTDGKIAKIYEGLVPWTKYIADSLFKS